MLTKGVYFAPSEHEANFLSFSHTKKDIEQTLKIVVAVLENIAVNGEKYVRKD